MRMRREKLQQQSTGKLFQLDNVNYEKSFQCAVKPGDRLRNLCCLIKLILWIVVFFLSIVCGAVVWTLSSCWREFKGSERHKIYMEIISSSLFNVLRCHVTGGFVYGTLQAVPSGTFVSIKHRRCPFLLQLRNDLHLAVQVFDEIWRRHAAVAKSREQPWNDEFNRKLIATNLVD